MKLFLISLVLLFTSLSANDMSLLPFNGNCITCHKETTTESAPSVIDFKKAYKNAFANKDDFIEYMATWVENPNQKASLMHDAIKKHGLMPHLGFDKDMLIDISSYIYDTDFEKRGGRYWKK